jgi:hypothetical protein
MGKRIINGIAFFLENLSAGIWIGALVTFGVAVAAPVFRGLPSVTLAGSITAQVLHRINVLETVALGTLIVSALVYLLQPNQRTRIRYAKALLVALMAANFFYYGKVMMPRMEHLRTVEIRDFDQFNEAQRAAREEFDVLHKRYTRLAQVTVFLGVGFLLLSAFERK